MPTDRSQEIFVRELFPHMDALKNFAFHLTYNEDDANDLVQETYLKAHKFIQKYDTGTNAKAWLFTILKNAYINDYRKKAKQPRRVDIDEVISFKQGESPSESSYVDLRDEIFEYSMGDEVTISLDSMAYEFRSVILLCDIEGFSYKEIAKILDLPIGTVRSRLYRARNILKEKLKPYASKLGYKDLRGMKSDVVEADKKSAFDFWEEE